MYGRSMLRSTSPREAPVPTTYPDCDGAGRGDPGGVAVSGRTARGAPDRAPLRHRGRPLLRSAGRSVALYSQPPLIIRVSGCLRLALTCPDDFTTMRDRWRDLPRDIEKSNSRENMPQCCRTTSYYTALPSSRINACGSLSTQFETNVPTRWRARISWTLLGNRCVKWRRLTPKRVYPGTRTERLTYMLGAQCNYFSVSRGLSLTDIDT